MAQAKRRTASSGRSRNTTARKTTARKSSGRRSAAKKRQAGSGVGTEIGILAVFAAAAILFLGNLGVAGSIGESLRTFQFGLCGTAAWLLPVFLLWAVCFGISNGNKYPAAVWVKVAVAALTLTVLCGILALLGAQGGSAPLTLGQYYSQGTEGLNGGLFGGIWYRLLYPGLGMLGSYVVLVVLAIAGTVFVTGKSFIRPLHEKGSQVVHHAREDMERMREDQAERAARRQEEKRLREERLQEERQRVDQKVQGVALDNTLIQEEPDAPVKKQRKGRRSGTAVTPDPVEAELPPEDLTPAAEKAWREPDTDLFTGQIHQSRLPEPEREPEPIPVGMESIYSPRDRRTLSELEALDAELRAAMEEDSSGEESPAEWVKAAARLDSWRPLEEDSFAEEFSQEEEAPLPEIRLEEEPPVPEGTEPGDVTQPEPAVQPDAWGQPKMAEQSETPAQTEPSFPPEEDAMAAYDEFSAPDPAVGQGWEISLPGGEEREQRSRKASTGESIWRTGGKKDGNSGVTFRDAGGSGAAAGRQGSGEAGAAGRTSGQAAVSAQTPVQREYKLPPMSLLKMGPRKSGMSERELKETAVKLQQTLQSYGVGVTVTDISCGPTVTRYELKPEQGVKVSKILSLSNDIKLNLAAADIRIEAPIPGKAAVGIEVPNTENQTVYLKEVLDSEEFKKFPSRIGFGVGRDIGGKVIVADLARMPHLLIAGATGSGKSVCINTIIMSILYKATPDQVKLIMIDPKMVELGMYNGIPHLLIPVVTDPKKAAGALNWAVAEMTTRYKQFAEHNVRDIKGFNRKAEEDSTGEMEKMPQIVVIVDELADLMMVAPGDVEEAICRLAQLARAAGIHLVLATQRPSVNVITGLIKANVPSRIAFAVSSGVDSRTILDMVGAEKLLGKGDMLFHPSGYPKPVRVQGSFVTDDEVEAVAEFWKKQVDGEVPVPEELERQVESGGEAAGSGDVERDEYFERCGRFIIEKEKASIGNLQRAFKIGFNRAARIMDQLADAGVVGPEEGTKARQILMSIEEFDALMETLRGA